MHSFCHPVMGSARDLICPTQSELASPKARLARRSLTGLRQQTGSFLPPAQQHHFCSYETLDPIPQTRALNQESGRVASEQRIALSKNSS